MKFTSLPVTFILPAWEDAKQEKQDEQSQEYNIQRHNGTFPNQIFEIDFKFQRPKITFDTWFQTEKDIPH